MSAALGDLIAASMRACTAEMISSDKRAPEEELILLLVQRARRPRLSCAGVCAPLREAAPKSRNRVIQTKRQLPCCSRRTESFLV